ncbi:MAG: YjbE family putative metal transport protein, partial [Betaproteobacteria bacterium]
MDFSSSAVWVALAYIIFTNILLSGDNAVVIAMASRNLPKDHQKKAIFWGSAAAIVMRIILTIVAVQLLTLPYLKIIGAILLIYIGVQLMADSDGEDDMTAAPSLFTAIRTILIADLVMSLDNVV